MTSLHRRGMGTRTAIGLAVLVLAACGGGDEASRDEGGVGGDDGSSTGAADGSSTGGGSSDASSDGGSSSDDGGSGVDQDGFVTVEGVTYAFTYDNFGRCGAEADEGHVVSYGNLLGDPNRQITFTYGLAEETITGEALMQVIVQGEDGQQLYYSAVGYGSIDDIGSVDSIEVSGGTVRITGQLQRVSDQTLVDFEGEATCDQ